MCIRDSLLGCLFVVCLFFVCLVRSDSRDLWLSCATTSLNSCKKWFVIILIMCYRNRMLNPTRLWLIKDSKRTNFASKTVLQLQAYSLNTVCARALKLTNTKELSPMSVQKTRKRKISYLFTSASLQSVLEWAFLCFEKQGWRFPIITSAKILSKRTHNFSVRL